MIVTRIRLKNWRNFRNLDVPLYDINYLLCANATGKSNFLDVFRFLRDICQESGGGFQDAIRNRGGLKMIRCLHARNPPEVEIYVELSDSKESNVNWRYLLAFRSEKSGKHRPFVYKEEIWKNDEPLLQRPTADDIEDPSLLTQTHLEQIQANAAFRELVDFFGKVSYLHLVPQLLKFGEAIGGKRNRWRYSPVLYIYARGHGCAICDMHYCAVCDILFEGSLYFRSNHFGAAGGVRFEFYLFRLQPHARERHHR